MSSARYAPLAGPDADQELHAAFESDSEDEEDTLNTAHESTPLTHAKPTTTHRTTEDDEPTSSIPGAYDFEREYDCPPPGSPPAPSSRALPNDFGNSNGLLPSTPVRSVNRPRPSFFRRAVGAILPSHYVRVPTHESSHASRSVVGAGIENDGVFANVMAKPQPAQVIEGPDGNIFMVPEDNQKEVPPTYSEAQADAVPPYWETTVHAPASDDPNADMIVDDLPTGSMWLFAINLFISFFFQFIGFLFTYLLHTSHAAKFGSRAGLGLTLIQLGFYSRSMGATDPDTAKDVVAGPLPTGVDKAAPVADDTIFPAVTSRDWLAFLFMTLGWFIFLSSVIGYWRIKRWESSIRAAAAPPAVVTPEQIERDIAIRRNISSVFGMSFTEDEEAQTRLAHARAVQAAEDARLTRDLRAAGLL
ncbi:metal homeostatis protein bsd2 [Lyophyllum atratum]|nr:metal homeostatis protein bsd2 [Lyophyllum atratum]